ncbi:hypothetical protein [Chryseobacterium sp. SIMBA_029]|uniref:hypothetical protein n=2 Tax=Pseudomonadati TaxID=3379134 RepID=UPI0039798E40
MKNVITLLLTCLSIIGFGQKYQKALLILKDGEQKQGLIQVNVKSLFQPKKFIFKVSESSEPQKIDISMVKAVTIFGKNNQVYESENIDYAFNPKKNKTKNGWALKVVSGYYNLYTFGSYSFDKEDNLTITNSSNSLPEQFYFIRKNSETRALLFGIYSPSPTYLGLHKVLLDRVKNFMSDNPELVAKVENKELSISDIERIVRDYNLSKSQ